MKIKDAREQLNDMIVEVANRKEYAKDQAEKHQRRFQLKDNWGVFAFWLWTTERWLLEYHRKYAWDVYHLLDEYHDDLLLQLRNLN